MTAVFEMAKESTNGRTRIAPMNVSVVTATLEPTQTTSVTALAHTAGRTATSTSESGKTVRWTGKVSTPKLEETSTMDSTRSTSAKEKELSSGQMARSTTDSGRVV